MICRRRRRRHADTYRLPPAGKPVRHDMRDALPVSERIYSSFDQCERMREAIHCAARAPFCTATAFTALKNDFRKSNSNGQHDNLLADREVKYAASDL